MCFVSFSRAEFVFLYSHWFSSSVSQERLDELHRLWELLLSKLAEKGTRLQQALRLVQFMRECREVMFWIADKVRVPDMNYTAIITVKYFSCA